MPDPRAIIEAAKRPKPPLPSDAQAAIGAWVKQRDQVATMHAGARATLDTLPTDNPWIAKQKATLEKQLELDERQAHYASISSFLDYLVDHSVVATYPNYLHRHLANLKPNQVVTALTDWLTTQLAGQSINDIATTQLAKEFREAPSAVTLDGNALTLEDYITVRQIELPDGRHVHHYALMHSRNDRNMKLLARALKRFQTKQATDPKALGRILHEAIHYNHGHQLILGRPIRTALRRSPQLVLDKDESVHITFASPKDARAFATFYGLTTDPTRPDPNPPAARKRQRKEPAS